MRCATLVLLLGLAEMPNAGAQQRASKQPLVAVYGGTGDNTQQKAIESGVDVLFPSIAW